MPKAPRQATSATPFPFVRQFTAPPFFVDIEDAKRKSQLLLDAVQHAEPVEQKAPVKRKVRRPAKTKRAPAKKSGDGKGRTTKKR
jgi:hypothetical protein